VSYDAGHVAVLIRELLILNRAERAPAPDAPSTEQLGQWKSDRKRIRQELVQVLPRRGLRPGRLVMENDIQQ
jgi:hypothetical protein